MIGEIGVLAITPHTANCIAVGETIALHISQTDFWDLLDRNSSLSVGVVRVLVPRRWHTRHIAIRLGTDSRSVTGNICRSERIALSLSKSRVFEPI